MAVERRTIWLGAALTVALLALVVARSVDGPQATGPAAPRTGGRAAARAGQATDVETAPDVNLALLTQSRGEPAESPRNPFRFKPKPPPPPPPVASAPPPTVSMGPAMPPVPSGPPPPPPIPLKFIGIVQKADGTRIAVLSDGKRPYYGVDGQEIEGQYRILKIGQESIEISYIDGRGRQTLRLSGQ